MLGEANILRAEMRKDWILPSCFLIFLLILIGGVAFLPVGADISASVKFDPHFLNLARPAPRVFEAKIRFEEESVADINSSTILLEGSLPPSTTYLIPGALVAEFDGYAVKNIMLAKIAHLGIAPPYKVWLTITGNFYVSAGGTLFSGSGYIKAWAPHTPPPP